MGAVKQIIVLLCCCFLLMFPTYTNNVCVYANTIVYITNTGKKYHGYNCHYLDSSKIAISLSEAIRKRYTACGYCGGVPVPSKENSSSYPPYSSRIPPTNSSSSVSTKKESNEGNVAIIVLLIIGGLYVVYKIWDYYEDKKKK